MSDEYQIEIPQSFMALYTAPGSHKPNAPRDVVAGRYELCEDMASMLTEPAKNMSFGLDLTETDVLLRCFQGLKVDAVAVTADEARWVICRLAELLDWAQPNFADVE
ncbi:MAG: ATPase with chaperone activity [Burkholderiaceae bacterium]|nr:MAG: ATPase with chaperone activity [Burkholderiaceae bacterium]